MASSLTIRLVQEDPDDSRNIAIIPFVAGLDAILGGWHTVAQVKSFFNMTAADGTAFDMLISKISSGVLTADKMLRIKRVQGILALYEIDEVVPGYTTPDEVEAKLLAIDTGP